MSDPRVAFISARLDEEETAAKAAVPGPWLHMHLGSEGCAVIRRARAASGPDRPYRIRFTSSDLSADHATAEHVARHDPAAVLRRIEADRKILDHLASDLSYRPPVPPGHTRAWAIASLIADALASAWSDHPDYGQGWSA